MRKVFCVLMGASLLSAVAAPAFASQQVYHFIDPTFGGNALNGSYLLSTASGQGFGAQSGQNQPNLSGLDNALSNLGSNLGSSTSTGSSTPIIIIPSGTNGTIP